MPFVLSFFSLFQSIRTIDKSMKTYDDTTEEIAFPVYLIIFATV